MKSNEERRKTLERLKQRPREGTARTLKEVMAEAAAGLTLQDVLMAEERKAKEASEETSEDSASED